MNRSILFTALLFFVEAVFAAPFDPDWGSVGVFSNANSCAACHRASTDVDPTIPSVMRYPLTDSGEDVSPSHQWQHSVMAHAFNDPYFQAKVEDEATVFPGLAGFIEDKCLTCHAPMGRTNAHQTNTDLTVDASCPLGDGCYRLDTASLQNHAREGVSCTLCHQIRADNLGSSDSFSGAYSIAAAGDPDALLIYGPHPSPVSQPMINNTLYTPVYGSQVTGSSHCATCHTLYTPTIDIDSGAPTGADFLEQAPFLEWQNSVYFTGQPEQQQCQDCHMPQPEAGSYSTRTAIRPNGTVNTNWPTRSPFYTHSMTGGNTYLLELLRDYRTVLEIESSTSVAGFDDKIAQTRELLQNRTATLSITRAEVIGDQLKADVRITNHTGHKLPTGFPSRRMWLHLTVTDSDNQVIFESGAADASGKISTDTNRLTSDCLATTKPAGFNTENCYEPHRDIIDDPTQVAIYETVLADSNDDITHVLLHAASYLKDNRLPPRGFINSRASSIDPQTLPVGTDKDSDFNHDSIGEGSGSDTVHYRVALTNPNPPYNIDAELLFQSVQPAFIASMHSSSSRVSRFNSMTDNKPPIVEILATDNTVASTAAPAPAPAPTPAPAPVSSSDGGGGCTLAENTAFDPVLPASVLAALSLLGLHRRSNKRG